MPLSRAPWPVPSPAPGHLRSDSVDLPVVGTSQTWIPNSRPLCPAPPAVLQAAAHVRASRV